MSSISNSPISTAELIIPADFRISDSFKLDDALHNLSDSPIQEEEQKEPSPRGSSELSHTQIVDQLMRNFQEKQEAEPSPKKKNHAQSSRGADAVRAKPFFQRMADKIPNKSKNPDHS